MLANGGRKFDVYFRRSSSFHYYSKYFLNHIYERGHAVHFSVIFFLMPFPNGKKGCVVKY